MSQDSVTGHWRRRLVNVDIGYWRKEIFTSLSTSANGVTWGGEIVNMETDGHHTATQMGSDHFRYEGFGKSFCFHNLHYADANLVNREADNAVWMVMNPECYDLQIMGKVSQYGVNFSYGDPGFQLSV